MELAKLIASIATPLTVAIVGYLLSQRLKSIDEAQWQNRRIIEKRLDLFDQISPGLNEILCFLCWIGYWKDISPRQLVETKRRLDKTVNIYRHLLSEDFYTRYNEFIHLAFKTYTGRGKDALIRSEIANNWGDRRTQGNYGWEGGFDDLFVSDLTVPRHEIRQAYERTLQALRACIGLKERRSGQTSIARHVGRFMGVVPHSLGHP